MLKGEMPLGTSTTPSSEEVVQTRAKQYGIELLSLTDAQKEMNSKLLSGWVMLNDHCPISNYPLVKDPQTGKVWSIRCQMEVASTAPASSKPPVAVESPKVPQEAAKPKQGVAKTVPSSSELSQRIGQKLLLGWTMLADDCPVTGACPLMQEPNGGRKWSAALDDFIGEKLGDQDLEPEQVTSTLSSSEEEFSSDTHLTRQDAKESDLQSKRIAERLIKGWAMLEDICPVTHACPLLREPRTNRKYSPALDRFLDELDGTETQQQPNLAPVEKKPTMKPIIEKKKPVVANLRPQPPAPVREELHGADLHIGSWKDKAKEYLDEDLDGIDDYDEDDGRFADLHRLGPIREETVEALPRANDGISTRSVLSGVSVNGDTEKELERAEMVIRSKMREALKALSSLEISLESNPKDLAVSNELVTIVGTCVKVLKQVRTLSPMMN